MAQQANEEKKQRPAKRILFGNVRGAVWLQQSEKGPWYATVITRRYKQGSEWKETSRFNRDDLPFVRLIAEKAFEWIADQESKHSESDESIG